MNPILRVFGLLLCLYWCYGLFILIYKLIQLDNLALENLWLIPLTLYGLILVFPYLLCNYYPNWVKKVLPKWLVKSMTTDYLKNFNTKIKDLPDDK